MRKILPLFLTLAMLLTLTACSTAKAPELTPTPTPEPTPEATPTTADVDTFWFDRDFFIETLDPVLETRGHTKLADIEPTVSQERSDSLGEYVSYTYALPAGGSAGFFETPQGDLTSIYFVASTNTAEDLSQFSDLIVITEYAFEGDGAEEIHEKLNADNISENNISIASGKSVSYTYIVTDGLLHFSVTP